MGGSMKVSLSRIVEIYEKEIRKNTKNKKKVYIFEKNKMQVCSEVYDKLCGNYDGGNYNCFYIYEPKKRFIMSQNLVDKLINHYVAREVLLPRLEKRLDFRNVATRKNLGLHYGLNLFKKYLNKLKDGYVLKLDIHAYFYSIDHEVLKEMLEPLLDEEEMKLVSIIIDSTNTIYPKGKGLPIGNMTSQILSIFYLSGLDHFIIHDLKLKYMVHYMDDICILHKDKEYLKECLVLIKDYLRNLKLEVNEKKTRIVSVRDGVIFLGIRYVCINH